MIEQNLMYLHLERWNSRIEFWEKNKHMWIKKSNQPEDNQVCTQMSVHGVNGNIGII